MSSTPKHGRTRMTALAAALAAALVIAPALPASAAELAVPYANDFADAAGLRLYGSANVADGWLELTPNWTGQAGAAALEDTFSTELGVDVTFDYEMEWWGGADGLVFYLADGEAPISIGAPGGGLGYITAGGQPGITGAYVGVGLDMYGNFSNGAGGPGSAQNSIVVRGSGTGTTGYDYIDRATGQNLQSSRQAPQSVRVTVVPEAGSGDLMLSVWKGYGDALSPVLTDINLSQTPGQQALPETLRIGFSAATGAVSNRHSIDDLRVSVPTDLSVVAAGPPRLASAGGAVDYSWTVANETGIDAFAAEFTASLPAGLQDVQWTCEDAAGATCLEPAVSGDTLTRLIDLPGGAGRSYTATAVVPEDFAAPLEPTATITAPADRAESEPEDNTASIVTIIGGEPTLEAVAPSNDTTPALSGTGFAGSTIEVRDAADDVLCSATATAGAWECAVAEASALPEGTTALRPIELVPGYADIAGEVVDVVVDTEAPASPTLQFGTSGPGQSVFSGAKDPDSGVRLTDADGAPLGEAAISAQGTWSISVSDLPEGPIAVTAIAFDEAGNESEPTTETFEIDGTPPIAPVIESPADGSSINDSTPLITGTAPDSVEAIVLRMADESGDPEPVLPSEDAVVPVVDGRWETQIVDPWDDGEYTLSAVSRDEAYNTATGPSVTFTIDTVAPAVPTLDAPTAGVALAETAPELSGTAEAGSSVTVRDASGDLIVETTADAGGAWSATPEQPLAQGAVTLTPTATDAAGNETDGASASFVVDTVAPEAPVFVTPEQDAVVADSTPTLSGTAEPGTELDLVVEAGTLVEALAVDDEGAWSFTPDVEFADGPHTVTATVRDAAGNSSDGSVDFTVDTVAPGTPAIGSPNDGAILATATPEVSGTGEAGSTITLSAEASGMTGGSAFRALASLDLGATVVGADGTWSSTLASALPEGEVVLVATATDAAGNAAAAGESVTVTVDTVAPEAPVILSPENGSTVDDASPMVSGTAEPGASITVAGVDGEVLAETVVAADGTWSVTLSDLADGEVRVAVTATDAAGNSASTDLAFVVDTSAPSVPPAPSPEPETAPPAPAPAIVPDPTIPVVDWPETEPQTDPELAQTGSEADPGALTAFAALLVLLGAGTVLRRRAQR